VAASSSHDARASSRAERFELLRELGSRMVPTWAALESLPTSGTRLVVAERVFRRGHQSDQEISDWVRDARRLAMLDHPNVARVRDVVIRDADVLVISDFVDGVSWSELKSTAQPPSLEVTLRVLVDVLSGLSAVHNLRDAKRQPLKLVHGELTPECVLVGLDGVARMVGAHRMRAGSATPKSSASGYLAPEVLLADDAADGRADVYSVGVMLWEALSGRPLFVNTVASAIVTQILSGQVPRATPPPASPWAAPLADVAARALAADAGKRFGSTAAFAAELRRIAGPKLAPTVRVSALVRAMCGDQIRARREALEHGERRRDDVSTAVAEAQSERVSIDVPIDVEARGWSEPPPTPVARAPKTARPLPPVPAPPPVPPRLPLVPVRVAPPAPVEASASKHAAPAVTHPPHRAPLPPLRLPPRELTATPPQRPPPVPVVVPAAPLVPSNVGIADGQADLVAPISAPPSIAPPAKSSESLPATARAPQRRTFLGAIVALTTLVAIVLVCWRAWRMPEREKDPASSRAPATSATAPPSPGLDRAAARAAEVASPTTPVERPAESTLPAASSAEDMAPPALMPASPAAGAAANSSGIVAAPSLPVRPVVKPKYDPQGI
jgi:eukaryotic-like serine/threonine-protein kinase